MSGTYQIQEKQQTETEYLRISKPELCSGVESGPKDVVCSRKRFRVAESVSLSALPSSENELGLIFQLS